MSYILDALRKADAERERDPARGIHAQAMATPAEASRTPVAAIVAGALVGLALVAAGAYAWRERGAHAPAQAIAAGPAAPAAIALVPAPAAMPPAPTGPAPIPVANAVQPPAPAPLAPPEPPKVVKVATVAPAALASPLAIKTPAPAAVASQPAAAASQATQERIVAQAELPPDVQRDLPKLAISGGVYSENPAQRMLIVGGQVVNEGAELAPGVVLEQIRARAAVLRFRGWRYSVGY